MSYDNAKRLKSSSGSPISVARSSAASTALPQYQPPPARGSPSQQQTPAASLSRASPASGKNSLKLTVKAAPSKLRQAISGSQLPPNPYADEANESDATPKPTGRSARATRNPRTVVEQDSDEEDEDEDAEGEDAEGEDDDEDAEGEDVDQELLANEDSQDDAEGEDEDMDELQDTHPPPPVIKREKAPGKGKGNVTVSAPAGGPLKSVEAKELEDDDDDDELSDLESGDEMEELGEGEEEEEIGVDDDDLSGSDDGSRSATPDITKLTRRQRGAYEEENIGLLALSNEAQKKKLLSVEEHAMRRQEMARRRKNLSEKRNEEEKMETINKLLSKPAPKRRTRAEILAAQQAADITPGGEDEQGGGPKANPLFSRWVNNKEGSIVAVPEEWLDSPLGDVFGGAAAVKIGAGGGAKMVEEVS